MIAKTLKQIIDELNVYLDLVYSNDPSKERHHAAIKNVDNKFDPENPSGIAVSLINVEEDKIYKNHLNPLRDPLNPNRLRPVDSSEPIEELGGVSTMRITIYLLFAFNSLAKSQQGYLDSLSRLTNVLRYFQGRSFQEITIAQLPPLDDKVFTLEMNYHNVNLEDSNNMWSNFGGEQRPYAMYQVKLLEIEPDIPVILKAVITHPNVDGQVLDTTTIHDINNN